MTSYYSVPKGWRLVPEEPTDEMVCFGIPTADEIENADGIQYWRELFHSQWYRAITSAPAPPSEGA